jgi:hypothetical protein
MLSSSCPPWTPDITGQTRRRSGANPRSYTTLRGTIRQMRETSRPVRPSLVYSMLAILHSALPFRERDVRAAGLRCGFYPVRNGRSWCSWRFALLSAGGFTRGTDGSNRLAPAVSLQTFGSSASKRRAVADGRGNLHGKEHGETKEGAVNCRDRQPCRRTDPQRFCRKNARRSSIETA